MRVVQLNTSGNIQAVTPLTTSSGAGDSGKLVSLDADGKWNQSVIPGQLVGFSFVLQHSVLATFYGVTVENTDSGGSGTAAYRLIANAATARIELDQSGNLTIDSPSGEIDLARTLDLNSNIIKNASSIGIGVAAPGYDLHISGGGVNRIGLESTDNNVVLDMLTPTQHWELQSIDGNFWRVRDATALTNPFAIDEGCLSDTLRIANAGRVGINQSSPANAFHVDSSDRIVAQVSGGDATAIEFRINATTAGAWARIRTETGDGDLWYWDNRGSDLYFTKSGSGTNEVTIHGGGGFTFRDSTNSAAFQMAGNGNLSLVSGDLTLSAGDLIMDQGTHQWRIDSASNNLRFNIIGSGSAEMNLSADGSSYKSAVLSVGDAQLWPVELITNSNSAISLGYADTNAMIRCTSSSAQTITIPSESSIDFPIGTVIVILQAGAGTVTIQGDTGVTLNSPGGLTSIAERYGQVSLIKAFSDGWYLEGNLA